MSKQQRDVIDAALRAEPFGLSQSTEEHRKSFEAFALRSYPADVAAADVTLGGVGAIELTVAGNAADPTVLYFHGGGYVAGSARTGTHLAAELARRAGGRALSVDYRLAPEHPYPAAVEDGLAAYAGLLESSVSPAQVLVAGDSAGGGLAVATLLAAREQGLPQPAAVAVFSPWADISRSGASMRTKDVADPSVQLRRHGLVRRSVHAKRGPVGPAGQPGLRHAGRPSAAADPGRLPCSMRSDAPRGLDPEWPLGPVACRGELLTVASLNTRGISLAGSQLAERYAVVGTGFDAEDADVVCCQQVLTYWHLRLLVRRMRSFRQVSYRPAPTRPAGGCSR
jgi:acetyl esterase/lipase